MADFGAGTLPASRRVDPRKTDALQTERRVNTDGTDYWVVRLYNAGAALVKDTPYLVSYSGLAPTTQNPQVVALASLASVRQQIVIADEAVGATSWGWFCYQGHHDCGVEGTVAVAADDFLKTLTGTSAIALFGNTTTRTVNSFAKACAAQAVAAVVVKRVYLFGDLAILS